MPAPDSSLPPAAKSGNRFWTFIRILNVRLRFILLMVAVGLVAGYWDNITNYYERWTRPAASATAGPAEDVEYFCPMHPQVIRAAPGSCPICGMPLSKRDPAVANAAELPPGVLARVQLTPQKVQMGRIATSPVEYRLLSRESRTVGIVDYDETRRAFIAARIMGRIDQMMVNYVGQRVERGAPLVSIYSPDLLVAQEELLSALRQARRPVRPGEEPAPPAADPVVAAARRKLELWGITEEQVNAIIARDKPETHLTITAPISGIVIDKAVLEGNYVAQGAPLYTIADLSSVWLQAKLFEEQMPGVQIGTAVEVTSSAYPSEVFAGRITFVAYTVDPATRTVAARVEIANPDYKLRPGMFATATIRLPVGAVTVVPDSERGGAASGPATGPNPSELATGEIADAYLALARAYADDKADAALLERFVAAARRLGGAATGTTLRQVQAIVDAAAPLAGKDLQTQREAFKQISSDVIDLVQAHPPVGRKLRVAHCPMAKADWLQDTDVVLNPYYGSGMLHCGAVTSEVAASLAADGADQERFASGYFCPIYPDELLAAPEECRVDKFPTKYVRVEKSLAIPQSAVVNTGVHKVVYRATEPGTFEMVVVHLGPRAGEFYPVLSGLAAGDRVATAGAFLVDAENRLNPAASAQYFGASKTQR